MKSLLKIFAAMLLSMSLANCAMLGLSGDDDENKSEEPTTMSDSDKESMDSDTDENISENFNDSDIGDKSEDADLDTADAEGGDSLDDDAAVGEQGYLSGGAATPTPEPEATPEPARGEASAPFKDGMYTFAEDCTMRQDPESSAASAGTVRGGKKLWVEGYDNSWVKVFKKSGPVFVSKGCL